MDIRFEFCLIFPVMYIIYEFIKDDGFRFTNKAKGSIPTIIFNLLISILAGLGVGIIIPLGDKYLSFLYMIIGKIFIIIFLACIFTFVFNLFRYKYFKILGWHYKKKGIMVGDYHLFQEIEVKCKDTYLKAVIIDDPLEKMFGYKDYYVFFQVRVYDIVEKERIKIPSEQMFI